MGRNKTTGLTLKEEEVMDLFWENGPMFVRELLDLYDEPKPHFNTLSTIVRSLEEKGYLSHRSYGKTYRYFAVIKRDEYKRASLSSVIGKYFDSSPFNAVSALVQSEELSAEELRKLLDMVENQVWRHS
ncbi:MAG: BlaI/MecI/CopY family transcriptional regulator [Bacteroidetes bacterium]|uniref:BlaI/MecI/CopY family transcriptional regulator n=1 Tax=Candidatus Cryptobacteroides excrementipullorum TaxID=2840761 RepID=A0A9D9ITI8_9BACT|nr:BlaI/MecI/CopY family transcriptional regulator [Candidatus Cryptobacteroides excrementipullorum]